jgi:hypothetical protein
MLKKMRSWLMGGFIFLNCSVLAQAEEIPCEDISSLLPYASYGIGFPKGKDTSWKCDAFVNEISSSVTLARWRKEEKKILFREDDLGETDKEFKNELIWDSFEAFLSDKNKKFEGMYKLYQNSIKGVLFGKSNNKIIVYHFDEALPFRRESMAVAFVYKKDSNKFLNIDCSACSFDEFMSYIVIPAISGPD